MVITVKFFTTLREITQNREEEVDVRGEIRLGDLLSLLSKKYGRRFTDYIYDEKGVVKSYIQFIVNGRNITRTQGLGTILRQNDEIAIIPPTGGGDP